MSWQHWVLVIWFLLEVLAASAKIGKERKPYTAADFAGALFTFIAWAFLAVTG